MKYIIQIPIFILMLFASGYSFASSTSCATLSDGDIEAFVTNACSSSSATGKIDLRINTNTGPWEVTYLDNNNIVLSTKAYIVDGNGGEEDKLNLLPGTYRVEVVDNRCAKAVLIVGVGIIDPINITPTSNPICTPGTGSISLDVIGGTEPYTFLWSNDETTQDIDGLSVGTFRVTVTDFNGCTASKLTQVKSKDIGISAVISNDNELCEPGDLGSISLTITNAADPVSIIWNTGATTFAINNLVAGLYTATITDGDDCTKVYEARLQSYIDIWEEGHPNAFQIVTHTCGNEARGSINIQGSNIQNCVFAWTLDGEHFPRTTRLIQNLAPGEYCVTVSHDGCSYEKCYEVKEINLIESEEPVLQPGCNGPLGSIGERGRLPYYDDEEIQQHTTYKWSHDPQLNADKAIGLSPGTYKVTISNTKVRGICQTRDFTYTLSQHNALVVTGVVTNGQQGGNVNPPTGRVDITVTGGSGDYSYEWRKQGNSNIINTNSNLVNFGTGTYKILVIDNETGCKTEKTFNINNFNCVKRDIKINVIHDLHVCALPLQNIQPNACNGCPKKIRILLNSSLTPVLPVTVTVTHSNGSVHSQVYTTRESLKLIHFDYLLPADLEPYTLTVKDACDNVGTSEFWTCTKCRPPGYERQEDNHYVTFDGGLEFEVQRPCGFQDGFFVFDSQIEIRNDPGINIPDGLTFTIKWPRGKATVITNPPGSPKTKKVSGDWIFHLEEADFDGRTLTVIVERSDGCNRELNFNFGSKVENVQMRNLFVSENAHHATITCIECNVMATSNTSGSQYTLSCEDGGDQQNNNINFKYKPYDLNAPCSGGGMFNAHKIVDGEVQHNSEIFVEPHAFVSNAPYYRLETSDPPEYQIVQGAGGGCMLNPIYLFDNPLFNKPVYVNWWRELIDLTPFPDGYEFAIPKACPILTIESVSNDLIVVSVTNEGNYVNLEVLKPSGPTSIVPMGTGTNKYSIKPTVEGNYVFSLSDLGVACPPISVPVYSGSNNDCPINFRVTPNPIKNGETIFLKCSSGKIATATATIYKKNELVETFIESKTVDIVEGDNEIGWDLNSDLQNGIYNITLDVENCELLKFNNIVLNFQGGGETENFKGTCDDNILSVVYSDYLNEYIVFTPIQDSSSIKIHSVSFEEIGDYSDLHSYADIPKTIDEVLDIRVDLTKNHYTIGRTSIGNIQYQKVDQDGNILWSKDLPNLNVKAMSDGNSGDHNIIAYDSTLQKYISLPISKDGIISTITKLPLIDVPYKLIHQSGQTTIALEDNGMLTFATTGGSINKNVPTGVTVKDIKTLANGNVVIAGEYKGVVTLGSKSYDSEGYKNAIFLTYDLSGNLVRSQSEQNYRDETVQGMASKGNEEVAYHGRYTEVIYYDVDTTLYKIDSCIFIHIVPLSNDSCEIQPPSLIFDETECVFLWDTTNLNGYTVNIQQLEDSVWITIPNANSPFYPDTIALYRILYTKDGCNNIVSEGVVATCINEEPCLDDPIDITYSEKENKFLYFYKTDGGGQLIKSEWISPVTYMMVDSFITWSCENITIKDIFVDENLNVYVIGCDPTLTNKTRIIKYNWSTKQIIWSQWYEKFIYYSTMIGTNPLTMVITGFSTETNNWKTLEYNKVTGEFISGRSFLVYTVDGKTGYQVDWIKFFRDKTYCLVSYHSSSKDIHYESQVTKWIASIPSQIAIREVVQLRNEGLVVGGDFTGTFTLNGVVYESNPYRSIIFIEYDKYGTIINVKIYKSNKHQVIKTFTTDGYYKFAYTGYTTENLNIGENVLLDLELLSNHPDACAMVDGGSLSETQLRNAIQVHPESVVKFYPNPFTKGINLDIDSPQKDVVSIVVTNSIGSVMFTSKVDVESGQNVKYLNEFEQLPSGVYTVKLKSDLMDHTTRVIRIE